MEVISLLCRKIKTMKIKDLEGNCEKRATSTQRITSRQTKSQEGDQSRGRKSLIRSERPVKGYLRSSSEKKRPAGGSREKKNPSAPRELGEVPVERTGRHRSSRKRKRDL